MLGSVDHWKRSDCTLPGTPERALRTPLNGLIDALQLAADTTANMTHAHLILDFCSKLRNLKVLSRETEINEVRHPLRALRHVGLH